MIRHFASILLLLVLSIQASNAQKDKTYLIGFIATFSPFSNTQQSFQGFSNDTISITTIDSLSTANTGFEFSIFAKKIGFIIGAYPNATVIGDRNFRARYTAIGSNSIVSTKIFDGHFETGSFLLGLGYRSQLKRRHLDFINFIILEKKTGRFIIHDDIYDIYAEQKTMSSEDLNNLPDSVKVGLNDLTQEKTNQFYVGLRPQISWALTRNRVDVGFIVTFGMEIRYLIHSAKQEVYSKNETHDSGGLSLGINIGIGMAIGNYGMQSRKK